MLQHPTERPTASLRDGPTTEQGWLDDGWSSIQYSFDDLQAMYGNYVQYFDDPSVTSGTRQARLYGFDPGREVFLNASSSASSCSGCCGRAVRRA